MTSIYVTGRNFYFQPYEKDCRQDQMTVSENALTRKDLINPPLFTDCKVEGVTKEIFPELGLILAKIASTRPIVEKLYSYDQELNFESHIELMEAFSTFWKGFLQEKGVAHAINFLQNLSKSHLRIATAGVEALLALLVDEKLQKNTWGQSPQEFIRFVDRLLQIYKGIPLENSVNLLRIGMYAYHDWKLPQGSLSQEESILLARLILERLCSYDTNNFHMSYLDIVNENPVDPRPTPPCWHMEINNALQELREDYETFQILHTLRLLEKEDKSPYVLPTELIKLIVEVNYSQLNEYEKLIKKIAEMEDLSS